MSTPRIRSVTLLVCCAFLTAVGTGCLGSPDVGAGATKDRTVTTEEATDRALTAEEEYITEQLENASCVESWGLTDYGGWGKGATVINRSAEGVYVKVTHPYWYGTEEVEADVGSEATYLVTVEQVQRLGGTSVSPC